MSEEITTIEETTTEAPVIVDTPINGYIQTIGRRKTSTAIVRVSDPSGSAKNVTFTINGVKGVSEYFKTDELVKTVQEAFTKGGINRVFDISVVVKGGGISAQADAIRHGIARALVELDPNMRSRLKRLGHLKRDPRRKERKKPGLRKARKAPQWSKR